MTGSEDAMRPNVVLIFMDDMTHWALRSSQVITPNLDRLRTRGATFTHAFNQGSMNEAVCLPARQMLLSGLTLFHADRHFLDVPRLGRTLTEAGYDTFFTGKWHNEPEALEADYAGVGPWGGAMYESTPVGGEAYLRPSPGNTWDPVDPSWRGHWFTLPDGSVQHSSEHWTDAAVGFLQRPHADQPFFLHLAYHAPHDPRQAPAECLALYEESEIAVPPNFMPAHPFDNGELKVRDEWLAPMPRTPEAVQLHRHEYFAILTHVDAQIGRVLDAVDLANTLVVFSGDHGLALGEHGLLGKQNPYDHSIRVPLILAGPGVPEGVAPDELVYSGSIYPTICDLLGVAVPEHIEFDSLTGLFEGAGDERNAIFGAYKTYQRLVRTRRHKLIEYPQTGYGQLFDLDQDPWELINRYDDEELAVVRAELTQRLRDLQHQFDDPLAV
ncbi:MAG: sulfatase-like hydrolase/transferase [Propionicimonas sp.]